MVVVACGSAIAQVSSPSLDGSIPLKKLICLLLDATNSTTTSNSTDAPSSTASVVGLAKPSDQAASAARTRLITRVDVNDTVATIGSQLEQAVEAGGEVDFQLGQAFIALTSLLILNFMFMLVAWFGNTKERKSPDRWFSHTFAVLYGVSKYCRKIVVFLAFILAFVQAIVLCGSSSTRATVSPGGIICKFCDMPWENHMLTINIQHSQRLFSSGI